MATNVATSDLTETKDVSEEKPLAPKSVPLPDAPTEKKPRARRRTREEMAAARAAGTVKNNVRSVKKDATKAASDIDTAAVIGSALQGIHVLLASLVAPECELTEAQAHLEGQAIADVLEIYDLSVLGKYAPWLTLVTVVIGVETPVIVAAVKKGRSAKRKSKLQSYQSDVVDIAPHAENSIEESL